MSEHVDTVVVGPASAVRSPRTGSPTRAGRSCSWNAQSYPPGSFARTPREMKRAFWIQPGLQDSSTSGASAGWFRGEQRPRRRIPHLRQRDAAQGRELVRPRDPIRAAVTNLADHTQDLDPTTTPWSDARGHPIPSPTPRSRPRRRPPMHDAAAALGLDCTAAARGQLRRAAGRGTGGRCAARGGRLPQSAREDAVQLSAVRRVRHRL